MKKIYSLLLATALLFSMTACGGGDTTSTDGTAKTENDIIAQEIADSYKDKNLEKINDGKPVTIRVHLSDIMPTLSETATEEQPDVFNSTRILQKAFELLYPNVTIEWARTVDTSSTDNFLQYMTTQLKSNTAPDIVFAWGTSFASRNWFYDFNEVLDQPNPYVDGNTKWRDQFPSYIFSAWQVSDAKNRVLGIPLSLAPGTPSAIYYNKDLLSQKNITVPRTWEELFKACEVLNKDGNVAYSPWGSPGAGNRKISTTLWDIQFSLGPFYAAKQADKLDYNHDGIQSQEEVLRASYDGHYNLSSNPYMQDMWKQIKRKYTTMLQEGYENADYSSKWLLGKLAFDEDGLWRFPEENSNTDRNFDFGVAPLPAVDVDTTSFVNKLEFTEKGPYRPAPSTTYNIVAPSVEAHGGDGVLDACVKFLQFLTQPDNNNMIISEQKGKSMSFLTGAKVPAQLTEYFDQPFPKVPQFSIPGGFTNEGSAKLSALAELWVKGQLSDKEFYTQFDAEFKKDIDNYIKDMGIDISTWK